jgi:ATP/maltotriose-dependent transcriptional regulator MalT
VSACPRYVQHRHRPALVVGDATVKTHVARIFSKLDLHDRAQAVVLAYETGLVVPGEA